MMSTCFNKRRLDDGDDETASGERKKPRSHRIRTSAFHSHDSNSPHVVLSASGTPNPYGPTPAESEDDDTMGLQHGAGNKGWLNTMEGGYYTGMAPDFEMADSHQGTPADALAPWSPVPMNAPALSPIPSGLVNQSLNMNDGHPTPPMNEHLDTGMKAGNTFTASYFEHNAPMIGNEQGPPSPVSDDGKLLVGGRGDSMDCDVSNGNQHLGNSIRAATTRGANKRRVIIAMGYRADCQKCQLRVPGHYSHFIHV